MIPLRVRYSCVVCNGLSEICGQMSFRLCASGRDVPDPRTVYVCQSGCKSARTSVVLTCFPCLLHQKRHINKQRRPLRREASGETTP